MNILLYPRGGLANRMRAIESAVNFCRDRDRLKVVWYTDWGMNCGWSDLFEAKPFIKDKPISRLWRFILKHHDDNLYLRNLLQLLQRLHILWYHEINGDEQIPLIQEVVRGRYLWVVIDSWEAFYPSSSFRKELFVLKDQSLLQKELSKLDSNTIGIHIRRTDHTWSVNHSPIELFEDRMRKEISLNPATKFYLCSDDEDVKDHFRQGEWKDRVVLPEGTLGRDSKEGIVQAAVEMFTLAHTKKIYGSYWSSFGEIAARIGGIPIEICATHADS